MFENVPGIYNGQGIYNIGGGGGGGGGDYHIWYDDIPYYAYKGGGGPYFNNQYIINKFKDTDIIETKLKWTLYASIRLGYGEGRQGGSTNDYRVVIGSYSGKIDFEIYQPYNSYLRTYGNVANAPYVNDTTHGVDCIKSKTGIECYLDGVLNSYNLANNSSSSWVATGGYYPFNFYQSGGLGPICNFYEQTIKDDVTMEEKFKFIPAKRKLDNKQGILEVHTGIFISPNETVNYEDYPL